ncbi:MAG: cell division protein FtsQ/DivIB, partial [Acidimicrobiaceae bacterium]
MKLAGVVVAAIVVIAGVLASPLFAIRRVAFEGVVYTSKETVEKVTESIKGSSIFTVDTAQAREQLLDDPWVAEVRITTDFPGKALVEVAERVPVVWYVAEDQKAR